MDGKEAGRRIDAPFRSYTNTWNNVNTILALVFYAFLYQGRIQKILKKISMALDKE